MLIYENGELQHTNTCIDVIEHSGIKGMKWGQRRAINRNKKALDKARALHYRQYVNHKSNKWKHTEPSSLTVALDNKKLKNDRAGLTSTGLTAAALMKTHGVNRKVVLGTIGLTAAGLAASKLNEARMTRKYNKLRAKDKQYLKKYDNSKVDKDIRESYKQGLKYINRRYGITSYK